jgi:hypothetical protein
MLRVVASNSGCCAVKVIRDFPDSPEAVISVQARGGHNEDEYTSEPQAYANWIDTLQSESGTRSAGEEFRRIMKQIQYRRPAGIIEINLAADWQENDDDYYCCEECDGPRDAYDADHEEYDDSVVQAWEPIFDEYGFTKIVALNSNSGAQIHHYTLAYDKGGWTP